MPFKIGEIIGPYRLVEQLGQGGMATVFKAYHPALDRNVAIKALHPAFTQEANFLARFQREAQVVARLEHPNIVPVYDYAEHEGRPYLVMKFIEGETLKARLERSPVGRQELLKIVESVGTALSYAHAQGVLHRDVKPSNVLLAKDGRVYLADFGLARLAERGESTITGDSVLGTPQYISPEQALGNKDLDNGADIYSFGVMLYELLVGKVPFNADTPYPIIHDHIYAPPPPPRTDNPDISELLEAVLLKALAKARSDRYRDMDELLTAWRDATWVASAGAKVTEVIQPARPTTQPEVVQAASARSELPARDRQTVVIEESQARRSVAANAAPAVKQPRRLWMGGLVGLALVCLLAIGILAVSPRLRARLATLGAKPAQTTQAPGAMETVAQTPMGPAPGQSPAGEPEPLAQLQAAQQIVNQNPDDPQAYLELALAYFTANRPAEAHRAIEDGIRRAGNNPDFILRAGDAFFQREAWLAAAGLYAEAIQRTALPVDSELQQTFNHAMYLAAAAPEADELIQRLPEGQLAPGIVDLFRGRNALHRGEISVARDLLRKLRETHPGMREIDLLELEIALKNGEVAAARAGLERLARDPELSIWARNVALSILETVSK